MPRAISSSRAKVLIPCALAIAAAGTVFLIATISSGSAHASSGPTVTQSDYSVFSTSAAGGASSSAPHSASAGEGNRPIASSMTTVALGKPNLKVTVAKSSEGGVCVFVERSGAKDAGGSCASPELLRTGATAQVQEANGEMTIAGIVPDGVSSVKVDFTDGASQTAPVIDNGWAIEDAPANMISANDVVGG